MSRPRFWVEVVRGKGGAWHHRTKASNGRIVQSSETYSSMRKCVRSAVSLANAARFELRGVIKPEKRRRAAS